MGSTAAAPQTPVTTRPGELRLHSTARHALGELSTLRLAVVVGLITAVSALVATVGADARWLAALGHIIGHRDAVPAGVPFAAAPTGHWQNTLVLAELAFDGLESALGDRGLIIAQLVAVAASLTVLACDARADGGDSFQVAGALSLAAVGSLGSLAVARVQMFSLVMFALLLALLRQQQRAPGRRIYLALPLLALWSNLHGVALLGLGILWTYLALSRFRRDRARAVAVALVAPLAMCLTPAGLHTLDYYRGLVTNVAAQRGAGLWAPLGTGPLDLLLIACALILLISLRHRRPSLWEAVVIVALAVLTVKAARNGVWLLFFLVGPASRRERPHPVTREWNGLLPIGALAAVALLALGLVRAGDRAMVGGHVVDRAVALAHGTPILADATQAEQVALAGGRIWAGNPLDAFSHRVQSVYLDWLAGDAAGRSALRNAAIRVVLVTRGSAPGALVATEPGFIPVAHNGDRLIYVRRRSA
jgi:hypothetical protein